LILAAIGAFFLVIALVSWLLHFRQKEWSFFRRKYAMPWDSREPWPTDGTLLELYTEARKHASIER
jgi:hypothetical protein